MEALFNIAEALSQSSHAAVADLTFAVLQRCSNPAGIDKGKQRTHDVEDAFGQRRHPIATSPSDHTSSSIWSRTREACEAVAGPSSRRQFGYIEQPQSRSFSNFSSSSSSSSSSGSSDSSVLYNASALIPTSLREPTDISGPLSATRLLGLSERQVDQILSDYRTLCTAGVASLFSTAASFPFDSLKSRLQVQYYPSIWACAKAVFREEGLSGFFRGVFIPLITISFVRTSSFSIYVNTKERLHQAGYVQDKDHLKDVALSGMAGGATSGVIISCGSAPFELVKVQRQLEYLTAVQRGLIASAASSQPSQGSGGAALQHSASGDSSKGLSSNGPNNPSNSSINSSSSSTSKAPPGKFKARSGYQAAFDIFKHHGGIKGFYIGFPLHLSRDTLGTALYFGSYDSIRAMVTRHSSSNGSLLGVPGPIVSFLSGSTAGIASWLIVYPVDLLKTNVQQRILSGHPQQLTGYQLFLHLLKASPPKDSTKKDTSLKRFLRLYRGLGVSALRSFISHGLTWTIIETLNDRITQRIGKEEEREHSSGVRREV